MSDNKDKNSSSFNDEDLKRIIKQKESLLNPKIPSMDDVVKNDKPEDDGVVYTEAEEVPYNKKDSKSIIIGNADILRSKDPELVKKSMETFKGLFTDLNAKYGFDIQMDFTSFVENLNVIIDPRNKRVVELYMSETFDRFKVLINLKLIQAVTTLAEKILDPAELLSESTSYTDKFIMLEKLFNFMKQLTELAKEIKIQSADLELGKISSENTQLDDTTNPEVSEFLRTLAKNIKEDNKKIE
jgi:hypothetical protein